MSILTLENVGKSFGLKPLFDGVTFGIEANERVALIGRNGSGKTTLLRVIAGEEPPDSGRVILSGTPVVGYLPQNPAFDAEQTVLDAVFSSGDPTMALLREYESACHKLAVAVDDPALMVRVSDLASGLEAAGAWELENDARIILDRLGISDTAALMGTLSGGQRKRVALANALIRRPDLLILDEPTNHLDADTIAWLETYLARYSGALLLVTHDRYFLDRVTSRIIEIDRGGVASFAGGYAYYLEKKEEDEARRASEERKRQALIRQELEWLKRGARARTTKQKARIDRAGALMAVPKEKPREELDIALGGRRLGSRILEFHDVAKSYGGRRLIEGFSYILQRGDRIGIIGPNGSGKTTLLDMVMGRVEPDAGRIELGETVVIGYYDQESRALDDERRVIDYIRDIAENIRTADGDVITAGQMLERFLFPPAMQYAPIGRLSGGERRRLYLLRVLMGNPNLLILDEPTNDLDIETLVALEEYLDHFGGCLIVVSHDRYFLDRTIDHLFRFEGEGRIREYPGNYSLFLELRERESASAAAAEPPTKKSVKERPKDAPRKLSYKERQELDRLEREIEEAETRRSEIETRLREIAGDYEASKGLYQELQDLSEKIERDMERWGELAEFA